MSKSWKAIAAGIGLLALGGLPPAWSALPAPTPEQQAEAAAKKAKDAAQAEQQKRELAASMERIAEHWRSRARAQGWQVHAPTAVADPAQGAKAPEAAPAPGARPGQDMPIRSEKLGTAPPSEDVKRPPPPQAVR